MFRTLAYTVMLQYVVSAAIWFLYLRRFWKLPFGFALLGTSGVYISSVLMHQQNHLQLQMFLGLPLLAWSLSWVAVNARVETVSNRHFFFVLGIGILGFWLQAYTAFYPLWFFVFFMTLLCGVMLLQASWRGALVAFCVARWKPLLIAGGVLCVGMVPFFQIFRPVLAEFGPRSAEEGVASLPAWSHYLHMGDGNYIWGGLMQKMQHLFSRHALHEKIVGTGIVLPLCLLSIFLYGLRQRRTPRAIEPTALDFALSVLAPTCVVWVLLSTFHGNASPWKWIHLFFPGANSLRAVSRYVAVGLLPLMLMVSIVAAEWFARWKTSHPARRWILAAVLIFSQFEQLGTFTTYDGFEEVTRLERAATELTRQRESMQCEAFFIVPRQNSPQTIFTQGVYQIDALVLAQMTGLPTVNGYSGQFPRDWDLMQVDDVAYRFHIARWLKTHDRPETELCHVSTLPPL